LIVTRILPFAVLFVLHIAIARVPDDLLALRGESVDDPPAAIAAGRHLLDTHKLDARPADEREVLYWLGNAALRQADDAVLVEMALRLDSLGNERGDELALAYAGSCVPSGCINRVKPRRAGPRPCVRQAASRTRPMRKSAQ
jgi:hypothetical protein